MKCWRKGLHGKHLHTCSQYRTTFHKSNQAARQAFCDLVISNETISAVINVLRFKPKPRKLFKSCDFKPCKPFAHYKEDINSIYLTKLINND